MDVALYLSMFLDMGIITRVCRLGSAATTTKRSTPSGIQHQQSLRISSLLEISIDQKDGYSPYVHEICKTQVVYTNKVLANLTAFTTLARSSQSELQKVKGQIGAKSESDSD